MENNELPKQKNPHKEKKVAFSDELLKMATIETNAVLKSLNTQLTGLKEDDVNLRIKQYGLNEIAREKRESILMHLLNNLKNPLVILLSILAVISYLTGDIRATVVIFLMVILGVTLRFFQEVRADNTAEKLKAMVSNQADVVRT